MKPDPVALVDAMRKRASIRRQIQTRKSVQQGQPDRIADQLDQAADTIMDLLAQVQDLQSQLQQR